MFQRRIKGMFRLGYSPDDNVTEYFSSIHHKLRVRTKDFVVSELPEVGLSLLDFSFSKATKLIEIPFVFIRIFNLLITVVIDLSERLSNSQVPKSSL